MRLNLNVKRQVGTPRVFASGLRPNGLKHSLRTSVIGIWREGKDRPTFGREWRGGGEGGGGHGGEDGMAK